MYGQIHYFFFTGLVEMYKAVLVLFFIVVCLTAIILNGLKDNFYAFF